MEQPDLVLQFLTALGHLRIVMVVFGPPLIFLGTDGILFREYCFGEENGGHLKPVTLKPVSRIFRIFRVFVSAFSAFSAFSLRGISSDPCFSGVRGPSAFSAFSPYRVRIADFENPTDRL